MLPDLDRVCLGKMEKMLSSVESTLELFGADRDVDGQIRRGKKARPEEWIKGRKD